MAPALKRGQLWLYDFARPDKRRPVVVISGQQAIDMLPTVMVAPITSTIRGEPDEVLLGPEAGLEHESAVKVDRVQTVPQKRLHRFLGTVDETEMAAISHALTVVSGCD